MSEKVLADVRGGEGAAGLAEVNRRLGVAAAALGTALEALAGSGREAQCEPSVAAGDSWVDARLREIQLAVLCNPAEADRVAGVVAERFHVLAADRGAWRLAFRAETQARERLQVEMAPALRALEFFSEAGLTLDIHRLRRLAEAERDLARLRPVLQVLLRIREASEASADALRVMADEAVREAALGHQRDSDAKGPGEGQILRPCPFCGTTLDADDVDCIHPVALGAARWALNCSEAMGGCGAAVLGESARDCVDKWNRRVPA